ncbi:Gfo/Idh/MocA family protein [Bauldia sp.]|uniref:Gfo/Idh/MocA family protein n=1 Tax=Bauldia sp. TaxID=2575872 RepID=UPI003BA968CE
MKAGVIGLGARAANVAAKLHSASSDLDFVAYCDPTPAGLSALEAATGSTLKSYDDLDQMLASETLDLLMIATPNYKHIDQLETALRSDVKHIFCEKPVVISEAETMRLMGLLRDHGGRERIMVGLVLRYAPLYKAVRQAQSDGVLGDIVSIEASEHIAPHHGSFFHRDWRRHAAKSGGFMLEKCCHDIDLYQGIAGARPSYVASFGGRKVFVPENQSLSARFSIPDTPGKVSSFRPRWGGSADDAYTSDGDIVDYQTSIVEYDNGVNLCFHTTLNAPDEFRRFAVFGTQGMAEGDFNRNYLRIHDIGGELLVDRGDLDRDGASHSLSDEEMARDVAAYLADGTPLPVTVLDALVAGLTAIKMDEARQLRSVVDLRDTWQQFDSYGLS